ncbi:MAG: DUF86 domain-containing protein [Calothrix sp. FI2-JRJ7]|jgi:uncharacterized protein YutE (UPF0331/DUF86 family)|nr:DUF86 domain-containing protein [Calothrix sp. FI2-JRJ7]
MINTHQVSLQTKLETIVQCMDILKRYENVSLQEYLSDYETRSVVERAIQSIILIAIRISCSILSHLNLEKSAISSDEAFIELGKCGVIASELAKQLAPTVGLANHLTYEYDCIHHNRVFGAIKSTLRQYSLYVQQINTYLTSTLA